jgi:hypothetical protein
MIEERDALVKKLDMLVNEFETANANIKELEQIHDGLVFNGASTDKSLTELTSATLHRNSLRRVINDIESNMIPCAEDKVEVEKEKAIEDIQTARRVLFDKCAGDIQKKMNDILKIVQTFDAECLKIEEEAGLVIGGNLPVFYIPENGRLQFSD